MQFERIVSSPSYSDFALGALHVIVVGGPVTVEMAAYGVTSTARMTALAGRHAVLLDYQGPLEVPSYPVRRVVVSTALGVKDAPIGARAFVIRGDDWKPRMVRSFFRATTSLGGAHRFPEWYAPGVLPALGFLECHVDGLPSYEALRDALGSEYVRMGLPITP